jgi:L-iditol 2-dehydrogenase
MLLLNFMAKDVSMKALVLQEYKQFAYTDVPDPEMKADEVVVRVKNCGICGSDIHGMDGSSGRRIPPLVMGHEASGIIASVGERVSGWQVGDRVTFDSTVYCGECYFCRRGEINLCENRQVLGVSTGDYRRHGAFAEYVVVPSRILYRLPDSVTFEQGAFVEPVSIAVHAIERTPIHIGDTAVVVGSGMIGLLVLQVLRAAGCGQVLAVDVNPARLDLAVKLGADEGLRSDQVDVPAAVKERTNGRGADVVLEVVGISPTVKLAIDCARKGGQVTLVGNLAPNVDFPLQAVVTREITLHGSCSSQGEYDACLDLIARGKINVDAILSATAPLAEGATWFKRLYDGEPGLFKVMLQP